MPAVSLHGVTIAWSLSGLTDDPLAEFLAGLAPATSDVNVNATERASPIVRIALRPAPPEVSADPRGEGWEPAFFHGIVEAHRGPKGFLVWDRASRVFLPREGGVIDAQIGPEREIVRGTLKTVLQVAFALALRPLGLFHLHAAALVLPSGAPAFVIGGSGAGKTTTTLALLEGDGGRDGASYLGDDTLYLTREAHTDPHRTANADGALHVVAFPRDFHVGDATLAAFPRLAPLLGPLPAYGTKRPLDAKRAYPGRFRASLALTPAAHALALFPSVVAGASHTELVPLARATAFGRLLGSSGAIVVEGVPGRDENLALLSALLGAVSCYEVRLGADALTDPVSAIATKLAELAREP